MARDATAANDTVPFPITGDKLRRRPAPDRAMAKLSWTDEADRSAHVTDESDGGIGANIAPGSVPPIDTVVTVRFRSGEVRRAAVRHISTEEGCVHLGLGWTDAE